MGKKQEKKVNNKGLTLIELIVSITILAIVVLPLLTAFVVSMRTNAKAKEKLRAIEIAHNFMEGVEATSLQDILIQLNYPNDKFNLLANCSTIDSVEVLDNGSDNYTDSVLAELVPDGVDKLNNITASIMKTGVGEYKFLGNKDSIYYFHARGIPASDNLNKKFDAFITIDGANPQDVSGTKKQEYNLKPVVDIESIDTSFDAANVSNVLGISKIVNDINTETGMGAMGLTVDDQEHLQRFITVSIERSNVDKNRTKVTLSYSFHCEEFDKIVKVGDDIEIKTIPAFDFPKAVDSAFVDDYKTVIYDNMTESDIKNKYLKNIYLFYQPWYTSNTRGAEKDIIRIDNPMDYDCTVKLIKQQCVNDEALGAAEQNYHMRVELNESVRNKPAHVKIETNLGTNISNDESFTDAAAEKQATYVYNRSIISGGTAGELYNIANSAISCAKKDARIYVTTGFGYSSMSPKGSNYHDRLYDIRIDMYPLGTDRKDIYAKSIKPIVTLTGGLTD